MRVKEFIKEASQGRLEDFITGTILVPNEKDTQREEEDVKARSEALEKYRMNVIA